jgi:hypothetical protein
MGEEPDDVGEVDEAVAALIPSRLRGQGDRRRSRRAAIRPSRGRQGEEERRYLAGIDSTQIRPPWRSTILRATAMPIPVPSYSSRVWRRWKITKIRS